MHVIPSLLWWLMLILAISACTAEGPNQFQALSDADSRERDLRQALSPVTETSIGDPMQLALVIGNAAYEYAPLAHPRNDAGSIAAVLREQGFKVTVAYDLNQQQLINRVDEFAARLQESQGVGLLYYAGHGVAVDGENYLIPVNNAAIHDEIDVKKRAVSVNHVLEQLHDAGAAFTMIILDAAHSNPFPGSVRSPEKGLAKIQSPRDALLAFAAAPGDIVLDDAKARNGRYARHLLHAIAADGLPVEVMFKRVRQTVMNASDGQQQPWFNSAFTGNFCFGGCVTQTSAAPDNSNQHTRAESLKSVLEQQNDWSTQLYFVPERSRQESERALTARTTRLESRRQQSQQLRRQIGASEQALLGHRREQVEQERNIARAQQALASRSAADPGKQSRLQGELQQRYGELFRIRRQIMNLESEISYRRNELYDLRGRIQN